MAFDISAEEEREDDSVDFLEGLFYIVLDPETLLHDSRNFFQKIVVRVEGKDIQISLFLHGNQIDFLELQQLLSRPLRLGLDGGGDFRNIEIPFRVPKKKPDDLLAGFGFDQHIEHFFLFWHR